MVELSPRAYYVFLTLLETRKDLEALNPIEGVLKGKGSHQIGLRAWKTSFGTP